MPTLRNTLIDTANIGGGDIRWSPLPPGSTSMETVEGVLAPYTVWVEPAAGDEITVEYRTAMGQPWQAWPTGVASAYAENRARSQIQAFRFSSEGGASGSHYGIARPTAAEWESV